MRLLARAGWLDDAELQYSPLLRVPDFVVFVAQRFKSNVPIDISSCQFEKLEQDPVQCRIEPLAARGKVRLLAARAIEEVS